jgi:chromate transport protein ChrA
MLVEQRQWMTAEEFNDAYALCASAFVVARAAAHNWTALAVMLAAALLSYMTRLNPLRIFPVAGLMGLAGLV